MSLTPEQIHTYLKQMDEVRLVAPSRLADDFDMFLAETDPLRRELNSEEIADLMVEILEHRPVEFRTDRINRRLEEAIFACEDRGYRLHGEFTGDENGDTIYRVWAEVRPGGQRP
jgi:hypothetical protein